MYSKLLSSINVYKMKSMRPAKLSSRKHATESKMTYNLLYRFFLHIWINNGDKIYKLKFIVTWIIMFYSFVAVNRFLLFFKPTQIKYLFSM